MASFVKSVEYVEITLTGATAVSANLTKSQTFGDCVPFYTANLSGVDDFLDRRYVDVTMESGPKVTAQRNDATGTVIVGIFVVEFDTTGDISVEQGIWDLTAAETATTETITSVTTTKAFCVIAYKMVSVVDDWEDAQVAVSFNSGTELSFDRDNAFGTISGHYYVVATSGTDFSVQHAEVVLTTGEEEDNTVITSVTLASTFAYITYLSTETSDAPLRGAVVGDLEDATHIRARRAFDSFGSAPGSAANGATLKAQIVSAGGTEFSVERNECDWGDALTKAVTITEIDQTKAIVLGGGYQGVMSSNEGAGADTDGNYAILDFTSDTEVTGTRATNTDPDGTTMFEVVEFVLAGGVNTTIVAAQGSYALTGQAANTLLGHKMIAAQGGYSLTGQVAITTKGTPITAAQGSYVLNGQAANTLWDHLIAAAQGSYTLSGQAAVLSRQVSIGAGQGAYALNGQAGVLLWGHVVGAGQGAYTLTGQAANTLWGRLIAAVQGAYALNGQAAITTKDTPLAAAQGAYALNGQAANTLWGRLIAAVQGAYALNGQAAATRQGQIVTAAQGAYALGGQSANTLWGHLVAAVQGAYALNGQAGILSRQVTIAGAGGAYALTGQAANTLWGRLIAAVQGAYALGGQAAVLSRQVAMAAGQGGYAVSGQAAILLWQRRIAAGQGGYVVTGQVAILFKTEVGVEAVGGGVTFGVAAGPGLIIGAGGPGVIITNKGGAVTQ